MVARDGHVRDAVRVQGVGGTPCGEGAGGRGVVAEDAHALNRSVDHAGHFDHRKSLRAAIRARNGGHVGPCGTVPHHEAEPVGGEDVAVAGHDELVDVSIAEGGLVGTVAQGDGTEGAVGQQEMEQTARRVHDHVDHATLVGEVVNVDGVGVVVGVEEHQSGVGREVEDATVGIDGGGTDVKVVRCERDQRVGRGKGFNDHLRNLSIRREVPTRSGVAVGVESAAVGAARGKAVGFTQGSEPPPVKQRGTQSVNDQLWFVNRHPVLTAGSDLEGHVGEDSTGGEGQVPVGGGSLTGIGYSAKRIKGDPAGVIAAFQWPRYAARFSMGGNHGRREQWAHGHEHHQDHHGQGAWSLALRGRG